MKRYTNTKNISKKIIQEHYGLEADMLTYFSNHTATIPFRISCFGITNPNKNYRIKRLPATIFVLEYIISGSGFVICNGKKYTVSENDVYILKPGDYCEYFSNKTNPYKKIWVNFQSPLFIEILKAYLIDKQTVFKNVNLLPYFERLFELEKISTDNSVVYPEVGSIIYQMVTAIVKAQNNEKNNQINLAHQIRIEIEKNITSNFNLDLISKKFHISKSEIIRYFKKNFGITPYQHLLNMRIELSKEFLLHSDKTLYEIATMFDFSSEYHFSNTFKSKVGVSPTNYKKQNKVSY